MPAIYQHKHEVLDREIDRQGHVNNLAYLSWMIDAAVAHSAAQDWNADRYQSINAGWVVRSHEIRYLKSAWPGDSIVVYTWLADLQKATCNREYRIVKSATRTELARAKTQWAWIRLNDMRPGRIPPEVIEAFEIVPADFDWTTLADD